MSNAFEAVMHWLDDVLGSGLIFDCIAALMIIEAAALLAYCRRSGRGPGARALLASIGAGFFLILAFKSFIGGASAAWTGFFLSGALAAHVMDLEVRMRR